MEVEGTQRKVVVRVPPDRQHYPESPIGREREMGVRRGARAKVVGWPTSTVSFTESITLNTQRTLSHAPRSERHTGVAIIFPFPHVCVCVNVSMHLHPQTH